MSEKIKKLILFYFKFCCKLILKLKKPFIISITGSAGKTTTKEIIFYILEKYQKNFPNEFKEGLKNLNIKVDDERKIIFKNHESLNNEFGIPFTLFLCQFRPGKNVWKWLRIFLMSILVFFKKYPKILVLELGVERPGDMKFFMDFIKPDIGIFTILGEYPAHLGFFQKKEDVAKEKGIMIENVKESGFSILNFDDNLIKEFKEKTKSKVFGFGKCEECDIKILGEGNYCFFGENLKVKVKPYDDFGIYFDLPIACSLGILKIFNAPKEILNYFDDFKPLAGRLRIFDFQLKNKKIYIFDDTYNASPASYFHILNLAKNLKGKKLGVFADLLEVDNFAKEIHEKILKEINEIFDLVFLIGPRMKFFSSNLIKIPHFIFQDPEYEKIYINLEKLIENFNFIFIKGARAFHLENLVKKFGIKDVVNCFCEYKKDFHNYKFSP